MADVFRCNATLEELVAHLVPSCHIREADGEIRLAVMDEVQFLAFRFRQCGIYSTLLQVVEQYRMREFPDLQLLEGWLGCLLAKGKRNGTDVWWKTQARMTLAAKVDLTPENNLLLTPEEFGRRGQFYFGLSAFEGFEFTDAFTG